MFNINNNSFLVNVKVIIMVFVVVIIFIVSVICSLKITALKFLGTIWFQVRDTLQTPAISSFVWVIGDKEWSHSIRDDKAHSISSALAVSPLNTWHIRSLYWLLVEDRFPCLYNISIFPFSFGASIIFEMLKVA